MTSGATVTGLAEWRIGSVPRAAGWMVSVFGAQHMDCELMPQLHGLRRAGHLQGASNSRFFAISREAPDFNLRIIAACEDNLLTRSA